MRVLVVTTDSAGSALVRRELDVHLPGSEAVFVERQADAKRELRAGAKFDLVILDPDLPDADSLTEALRAIDPNITLVIIPHEATEQLQGVVDAVKDAATHKPTGSVLGNLLAGLAARFAHTESHPLVNQLESDGEKDLARRALNGDAAALDAIAKAVPITKRGVKQVLAEEPPPNGKGKS